MTDRKKTSTHFWLTVALVAVLVGYPLSFGPACWLIRRDNISRETGAAIYKPLLWALFSGPSPIQNVLRRYCEYFSPPFISGAGTIHHRAPHGYGVLEQLRDVR